jgi:hypothetical protein
VTPYTSSERQLLVFPGHRIGSIQLLDLTTTESRISSAPVNISAHQTEIACLAMNKPGTTLTTVSTKGTLIRVFDTNKRSQLVELCREKDVFVADMMYILTFQKMTNFDSKDSYIKRLFSSLFHI